MLKKFVPLLPFSLIYLVNKAHCWFDDNPNNLHNIILFEYRPMTNAWQISYIAQNVIIPLLVVWGIHMILKRAVIDKIYRLEFNLYKWFVILNSILYFLIFRQGDKYQWIYWIIATIALYNWCKKGEYKENNNKDV